MSEPTRHDFEVSCDHGARIELPLTRIPNPGNPPVLLLHGASAQSETFQIPGPDLEGEPRSLARWLLARRFEPWLLDWRGSRRVIDREWKSGGLAQNRSCFDYDHAAQFDVPQALLEIMKVRTDMGDVPSRITAIGHCLGAGVLAQAIAQGTIPEPVCPSEVVLLTLGLFYEPTLESGLKSQDRVLERLLLATNPVLAIDPRQGALVPDRIPRGPWPNELDEIYRNWPSSSAPHLGPEPESIRDMCNRTSFMYGTPFLERQLVAEIHDDAASLDFEQASRAPQPGDRILGEQSGTEEALCEIVVESGTFESGTASGKLRLTRTGSGYRRGERLLLEGRTMGIAGDTGMVTKAHLPEQFGAIPLHMYTQGARNVRRGCAGEFDAGNDDRSLIDGDALQRFDDVRAVTLITGARNQLWHRKSIDKMHEWLRRGRHPASERLKWVLRGFGHQDLLWGREARQIVFPRILEGLHPTSLERDTTKEPRLGIRAPVPDQADPGD